MTDDSKGLVASIGEAFTRPVSYWILLQNMIPVAGVLFFGWKAFLLLLFYWLENVVIGLVNLLKIAVSGFTKNREAGLVTLFLVPFFVVHYGIFCFVHGMFLLGIMAMSGALHEDGSIVSGDFDLIDSVQINGAGAGSTIVTAQDADRVFDLSPTTPCGCTVGISGLTITHGRGMTSNFNVGAGIYIGAGTTVTLTNDVISNNVTVNNTGGGIENRGSLTVNGTTFQDNTAKSLGGGIYSIGPLSITGSTFTGNQAESGGAIYVTTPSSATTSIDTSTFSGNSTVAHASRTRHSRGGITSMIALGTMRWSRSSHAAA